MRWGYCNKLDCKTHSSGRWGQNYRSPGWKIIGIQYQSGSVGEDASRSERVKSRIFYQRGFTQTWFMCREEGWRIRHSCRWIWFSWWRRFRCWGQSEESRRDLVLKPVTHLKDRMWTGPKPCPRVRKPLLVETWSPGDFLPSRWQTETGVAEVRLPLLDLPLRHPSLMYNHWSPPLTLIVCS